MATVMRVCTGFEFGAAGGLTIGNAGNKIFDVFSGAGVTITATAALSGSYGLRVNNSGATGAAGWNANTWTASQTRGYAAFKIKIPSLPGASVILAQWLQATLNGEFRYNASTGKWRVEGEGGTGADGPTATTAETLIELYWDVSGATYTLDWWVDGVAQTQVSTSTSAGTLGTFELGCSSVAQTMDVYYDNVVVWTDTAEMTGMPFGAHKVVMLIPDTGGSLDVSTITTSEWNTFAGATPTLTAWDATTALGAIDEIPPGLGASADGFCRITGTDADYVGIPFTTYTLQAGESIAGARMLACCWAASGTTCFHSFASYNGTTATTLFASADVGTDNSATAPAWVCKMVTPADFDTQGELDALQIRFGSTDVTPDAGIHAVYVEVAVKLSSATEVTLTPATMTLAGVAVTPVPQPVVITLTPATMTLTAIAVTATPPASEVTLTPATMTLAAIEVTPVPQPVTVTLTPATMTLTAVAVSTVVASEVTLTPAVMTLTAVAVTATPQPVTVALTPAVMALAGVAVTPVPQPVVIALTPATMALAGVAVTPVPQPVTLVLTPATATLAGVAVTPVPQPVTVVLTPATMTLTAVAIVITTSAGVLYIRLDGVLMSTTLRGVVRLNGAAVAYG